MKRHNCLTDHTYIGFESWEQLLDHVGAGYNLWYQAPMDYRPAVIQVALRKDGKLRVTPVYGDADPFTADLGHLDRFRREVRNDTQR